MRKFSTPRHVLAVTLVAVAMSADRAAVAAPVAPPQADPTALRNALELVRNFAGKLAGSFSHAAAPLPQQQDRRDALPATPQVAAAPGPASPRHLPLSPSQFRLPPPLA